MPPISVPLTTTRSNVFCAKRPNQRAGRDDERVDQLVEVPLVLEERRERREARVRIARRERRVAATHT